MATHDCPRCINGTLFYDKLAREWWCLNCGYHRDSNGSELLSIASKIGEDDGKARGQDSKKSVASEWKLEARSNKTSEALSFDEEIAELRRRLRSYANQKKLLFGLLKHGDVTRDYLLDELNHLDKERGEEEKELNRLCQIRDSWRSVLKVK